MIFAQKCSQQQNHSASIHVHIHALTQVTSINRDAKRSMKSPDLTLGSVRLLPSTEADVAGSTAWRAPYFSIYLTVPCVDWLGTGAVPISFPCCYSIHSSTPQSFFSAELLLSFPLPLPLGFISVFPHCHRIFWTSFSCAGKCCDKEAGKFFNLPVLQCPYSDGSKKAQTVRRADREFWKRKKKTNHHL